MKHLSSKSNPPIQDKLEKRKETTQEEKEKDKNNEEEERASCEWDFRLSAIVSSSTSSTSASSISPSDTLGVIEFDPFYNNIIATGGIARKIRIYTLKYLLKDDDDEYGVVLLDHATACDYYICTPAKLSSIRWKPGSGGRILGSGDYDGVITEYDLERKVPVFERDEHGGRRVWSVDYSTQGPVIGASGSDDGTMQVWDPRSEGGQTVATLMPSATTRSPVCCVEFNPFGGSVVAAGCADRRAYVFDVRNLVGPVSVLEGHRKTVSYVRFLEEHTMVSAGTDGCLKLWEVNQTRLIRTYSGHVNNRSFVGLSVWRKNGLLGCGSENNRVFVYDRRWSEPIWVHEFGLENTEMEVDGFVSSVCWRQVGEDKCTLVAGGSDGVLQVFVGKRKPVVTS